MAELINQKQMTAKQVLTISVTTVSFCLVTVKKLYSQGKIASC
jgi:hypothetical protein